MSPARLLKGAAVPVGAVVLALAVGAVLVAATGGDPVHLGHEIVDRVLLDYWGLSDLLSRMSPLLLAGIAVAIPLRAGLYNVGAEGQIYMGGLFATVVALNLPAGVPMPVAVLAASLAGAAGGALWAGIAGVLKARRGIDEVVTTLLMNYVALNLISYAASGPLKAPGAPYPYSPEIPEASFLPLLMADTEAHLGVVIGLLVAVLARFALGRTAWGYGVEVAGKSPGAATYAGIAVGRTTVIAFALGGAAAGLAGAFEVIGLKHRLYANFAAGYGYDGLVVAFLAAGDPVWSVISAAFMALLRTAVTTLKSAGLDATAVTIVQGLIVLFAASGLALQRYGAFDRLFARRRRPAAAAAGSGAAS